MEIIEAEVEHAEQLVSLYQRAFKGHYCYEDFADPGRLQALIDERRARWMVAVQRGRVVGSSVGWIDEAHMRAEIRNTAVLPEHSRAGLARALCGAVFRQLRDDGIELVWGSMRNIALVNVAIQLGMRIVGFDPGIYELGGREGCLRAIYVSPEAAQRRIRADVLAYEGVPGAREIERRLGLTTCPLGVYPEATPATTQATTSSRVGRFDPRNRSLEFEAAPEFLHTTVLIHKRDEISAWERLGLSVTGFLPAWHRQGVHRYDCVRLTRCLVESSWHESLTLPLNEISTELGQEGWGR